MAHSEWCLLATSLRPSSASLVRPAISLRCPPTRSPAAFLLLQSATRRCRTELGAELGAEIVYREADVLTVDEQKTQLWI
jgi:hypothetical protein